MKLLEFDLPPFSEILSWCKVMADLGYLDIDKYYEIKELLIPHKKPRKSKQNPEPKLSDEQKAYNKQVSSIRIAVEHAIGGLKQFGILVQVFRNRLENFDDLVIEIAAGLWNLKLSN
ncbi:MAG: transposase [Saprospiraceae bacterium]|nr:transposase [Saprospiraceae bacterium]